MSDITAKTAERSPYILVCFQECERMNALIHEIRRSLKELDLGLKVHLMLLCACTVIYTNTEAIAAQSPVSSSFIRCV